MEYTAILSFLERLFSGTSGVLLMGAIGVAAIIYAHVRRMKSSGHGNRHRARSYQDIVIEPYTEEEPADPLDAMMPKFTNAKQQF